MSSGQTKTYYIYFNKTGIEAPSYTPEVSFTIIGGDYKIQGDNYTAYISQTYHGGKHYKNYNPFLDSYWSCDERGSFHWNPDYKTTDDKWWSTSWTGPAGGSIVKYQSGPLFIMVTSKVNFTQTSNHTASPNVCNITYRFFRWGWICETNSTFHQTLTPSVFRNNEWVFDPQIMPKLTWKDSSGVEHNVTSTQ